MVTPAYAPAATSFSIEGELGQRIEACIQHFDIPLPLSSPQLTEMFRNRNWAHYKTALVDWAGEFVGKYLTHATGLYLLSRDSQLLARLKQVVKALEGYQAEDGCT